MFGYTQNNLILIWEESKAENDGLEGKNVFILVYETNSGDVGLNKVITDHSCIQGMK